MSFLSRLFGQSSANHPVIAPQEYQARFVDGKQPHTLVDVRSAEEYAGGHIPGSVNIAVHELNGKLNRIPKDKPVIVYCASGHRAAMANAALHMLGFDNVRAFPAGYGAWEAAGEPTE